MVIVAISLFIPHLPAQADSSVAGCFNDCAPKTTFQPQSQPNADAAKRLAEMHLAANRIFAAFQGNFPCLLQCLPVLTGTGKSASSYE
jgi:hypothetical protein